MSNAKTSPLSQDGPSGQALPVVDLRAFARARNDDGGFPLAFASALRHFGCVGVRGHGVAAATLREHDAAARAWLSSTDPARLAEFAFLKKRGIDRGYLPPHERRSNTMGPGDLLITPDLRIDIVKQRPTIRAIVRSAAEVMDVPLPVGNDRDEVLPPTEVVVNGLLVSFRLYALSSVDNPQYTVTIPDRKHGWVAGPDSNLYPKEAESFARLNQWLYLELAAVARDLLTALDVEIEMRTRGLRRNVLRSLCSGTLSNPVTHNILRSLYYPAAAIATFDGTPAGTKIQRGGTHNDLSLMSVLTAASAEGLEVLTRSGDWFDVPRSDDLLYVVAGDTMKLLTHDLVSHDGEPLEIAPTTHRVTGTVETAVHPRTANILFVNVDMAKPFRSPVTGEAIRYRDPAKNIDVELLPGLRLLHARLQANGTLAKDDSFDEFAARAANLPQRMAEIAPTVPGSLFLPLASE